MDGNPFIWNKDVSCNSQYSSNNSKSLSNARTVDNETNKLTCRERKRLHGLLKSGVPRRKAMSIISNKSERKRTESTSLTNNSETNVDQNFHNPKHIDQQQNCPDLSKKRKNNQRNDEKSFTDQDNYTNPLEQRKKDEKQCSSWKSFNPTSSNTSDNSVKNMQSFNCNNTKEVITPTSAPVESSFKVAILSKKSSLKLTVEQIKTVQEAIIQKIIENKNGKVKPYFLMSSERPGFLLLTCGNKETSDWVIANVDNLKLWDDAAVEAVTGNLIPKAGAVYGFFPDCSADKLNGILDLLEAQNQDLFTEEWKILNSKFDGDGVFLTILVNPISMRVLRKLDYRVRYRFGEVQLCECTNEK